MVKSIENIRRRLLFLGPGAQFVWLSSIMPPVRDISSFQKTPKEDNFQFLTHTYKYSAYYLPTFNLVSCELKECRIGKQCKHINVSLDTSFLFTLPHIYLILDCLVSYDLRATPQAIIVHELIKVISLSLIHI